MEDRRDRRLDTWIETGRQFVDGVSGRRPGQRRSSFDLDSVGRWVGDKVEWLLEEDDAWREPWQDTDRPLRSGRSVSCQGSRQASSSSNNHSTLSPTQRPTESRSKLLRRWPGRRPDTPSTNWRPVSIQVSRRRSLRSSMV